MLVSPTTNVLTLSNFIRTNTILLVDILVFIEFNIQLIKLYCKVCLESK